MEMHSTPFRATDIANTISPAKARKALGAAIESTSVASRKYEKARVERTETGAADTENFEEL